MAPGITVTCGTATTKLHCLCHVAWCKLDTWQIFNLKKIKKIKKSRNGHLTLI